MSTSNVNWKVIGAARVELKKLERQLTDANGDDPAVEYRRGQVAASAEDAQEALFDVANRATCYLDADALRWVQS